VDPGQQARVKIQGGWFDPVLHEYFDETGRWVPSTTQILSLSKYANFDNIPTFVLENAAERGDAVHWLTEIYDEEGAFPAPGCPAEYLARFEGYRQWKEKENFIPEKIEFPVISSVYGMAYGCTLDRIGTLANRPCILELKFTYGPSKTWSVQLASQELALSRTPTLGKYLRVACHVDKHGVAKSIIYRDPQDAQRFIFALGVVWTRIDLGQDLRKELRS
jgi:hypothetical protein